jgi:hypothetical protein
MNRDKEGQSSHHRGGSTDTEVEMAFLDLRRAAGPRPPFEASRNLARKDYDRAMTQALIEALKWPAPRYVARASKLGVHTVNVIYDEAKQAYPALLSNLRVPQSFPSPAEAQAWADEHLNGGRQ